MLITTIRQTSPRQRGVWKSWKRKTETEGGNGNGKRKAEKHSAIHSFVISCRTSGSTL